VIEQVAAIVREIEEHRTRFEDFCRSLSDEELDRLVPPDREWQVKDYISHLATIDQGVQPWFEALAQGKETPRAGTEGQERFDVDRWNQGQIERRREHDVEQILAEGARHREMLKATMNAFQEATLESVFHFPGDAKRPPMDIPFGMYLRGWAKHDPMHAHDMLRALPERADDPGLRDWLACLEGLPGWRPGG
jgi:DinB superfamily